MNAYKKTVCRLLGRLALAFFLSTIAVVLIYRVVPVYLTPLMVIRLAEQLTAGERPVLHHTWVPLERISPQLVQAVVAAEDNLFMEHWGFDFQQIKIAMKENKRRSKPRGASTISQQTAKNVFLWPSSTLVRKGFEVYFTVLIELIWGKKRIMEVYLNSIEMGESIYGAESVARLHFQTSAARLSRRQSATIAATLPNPLRYNSAAPSPYIEKRRQQIQRLMTRIGTVNLDDHGEDRS
ncbi:MAG: monofunctional biosynthetic peptidoglycan transglycosylase [Desulfopila sp.]